MSIHSDVVGMLFSQLRHLHICRTDPCVGRSLWTQGTPHTFLAPLAEIMYHQICCVIAESQGVNSYLDETSPEELCIKYRKGEIKYMGTCI